VFRPTEFVWESIERELDATDCGVFVLTPDDLVLGRGRRTPVPRDNVILELGLFGGRLGRHQAVAFVPRGRNIKLPSDLLGMNFIDYGYPDDPSILETCLAPACERLRRHLRTLTTGRRYLTWEDTCALTKRLAAILMQTPRAGGYNFNAIVGLPRGGIAVADLLSRRYAGNIPILCLWAEWDKDEEEFVYDPSQVRVNEYVVSALRDESVRRILVVDDAATRGCTVNRAKDALVAALPEKK